jgi:hypothetical protein
MARAPNFDRLFDQIEAAIITARAMKLNPISDLLLLAMGEATQLMSRELLRSEEKTRRK